MGRVLPSARERAAVDQSPEQNRRVKVRPRRKGRRVEERVVPADQGLPDVRRHPVVRGVAERPAWNPTNGFWGTYPFEFFKILVPLVASNSFPRGFLGPVGLKAPRSSPTPGEKAPKNSFRNTRVEDIS